MLDSPRRARREQDSPLPLPRYHQIYLVLREQLVDGRYDPAQPMPGELELAQSFGVSRVTMRAALDRLTGDGLISRHRGRGTFARPVPPQAPARTPLSGLLENILAMGLRTSVRLLDLETMPAPAEAAEALRIAPGALVQRAVRVRSYRGTPLSHITTFVPERIAKSFGRRELAAKPMLALLEAAGVKVASAEQSISAKLADQAVAPLLEVALGSPLLAVTRTVCDDAQTPVQFLRGLYRPDRYEYRMQLTRSGGDRPRVWVADDQAP